MQSVNSSGQSASTVAVGQLPSLPRISCGPNGANTANSSCRFLILGLVNGQFKYGAWGIPSCQGLFFKHLTFLTIIPLNGALGGEGGAAHDTTYHS